MKLDQLKEELAVELCKQNSNNIHSFLNDLMHEILEKQFKIYEYILLH